MLNQNWFEVVKSLFATPRQGTRRHRPSNLVAGAVETLDARVVLAAAPTAPTAFAVSAYSPNEVSLTWNDVKNEKGYRIYQNDGGGWEQISSHRANSTYHYTSNLEPATTYSFYVEAFNAGGTRSSSIVSITTPPLAPDGLTATAVSDSQVELTWDDTDGENGYRVYAYSGNASVIEPYWSNLVYEDTGMATSSKGIHPRIDDLVNDMMWRPDVPNFWTTPIRYGADLVATLGPDETAFDVTGLDADTEYHFYVEAFNATGSDATDSVNATTFATLPPTSSILSAPTGLKGTATSTSTVSLSWNDVKGADGYIISRDGKFVDLVSAKSSSSYGLIDYYYADSPSINYTSTGRNYFTVSGLSSNRSYKFSVVAFRLTPGGMTLSNSITYSTPGEVTVQTPSVRNRVGTLTIPFSGYQV